MTRPSLRPLGVGEILDAGIKLYLRHWRVFVLCVVGFVVPMAIVSVLIQSSVDPDQLRIGSDAVSDTSDATRAGLLVIRLLEGLTELIAATAIYKAASDAWLGGQPTAGASVAQALRRLPALLGFIVLFGLAVIFALFLLGVVGSALGLIALLLIIPLTIGFFWLVPIVTITLPVLVLEGLGPIKSWRRANDLVRDRWWATFWTIIVALLLTVVLNFIVGFVLGIAIALAAGSSGTSELVGGVALVIITTLSYAIAIPYSSSVHVVIYYDRRVRREGLDLELAATAEDAPPAGDGAWHAPAPDEAPTAVTETPPTEVAPAADSDSSPPPAASEDPASPAAAPDESSPAPAGVPESVPPPRPAGDRAGWLPPETPRGPGGL